MWFKRQVFRGFAFTGKAALFCVGVFALLALAVVTAVLVPVMLMAIILPTASVGHVQSAERYARNAPEAPAERKAVATSRPQAG